MFEQSAINRRKAEKALADAQSGVDVVEGLLREGVKLADVVTGSNYSRLLAPFATEAKSEIKEDVDVGLSAFQEELLATSKALADQKEDARKARDAEAISRRLVQNRLELMDTNTKFQISQVVSKQQFPELVEAELGRDELLDRIDKKFETEIERAAANLDKSLVAELKEASEDFKKKTDGMGTVEILALLATILGAGGAGTIAVRSGPSRSKAVVDVLRAEVEVLKAQVRAPKPN